jgi:hypothetical protein
VPLFVHERHSTQAILETLKSHKASGTNLDLFGDAKLDFCTALVTRAANSSTALSFIALSSSDG